MAIKLDKDQLSAKALLEQITNAQNDVHTIREKNLQGEQEAVNVVKALFDELNKVLVPIVKLKVTFSENSIFKNREYDSIKELAHHFNAHKPKDCCDKTDVVITFANGFEYKRSWDVSHKDTYNTILNDFLKSVKFYAGLRKPRHMTEDEYQQHLKVVSEYEIQKYSEIYYTYKLGI